MEKCNKFISKFNELIDKYPNKVSFTLISAWGKIPFLNEVEFKYCDKIAKKQGWILIEYYHPLLWGRTYTLSKKDKKINI